MSRRTARLTGVLTAAWLTIALLAFARQAQGPSSQPHKPKVRAVTAFVRLDRAHYKTQIQDAVDFLQKAKTALEQAGYEVQTIRITTQPFPEYTSDLSPDQALGFFRDYDALAVRDGFDAAIGPANVDGPKSFQEAELLGEILASTKSLEGSITIAGPDGIQWDSIRAASAIVKYLEANTPRGQGNFKFAAAGFVPSGGPFYPSSYFSGSGTRFAIGLESANLVTDALSSTKSPEDAEVALTRSLGVYAQEIQTTARQLQRQTGWKYGGIDLSPASAQGASIGDAFEKFLGAPVGSSGTLTVAALITRAIRAIPVQQAGYSGLMLPVLEDPILAKRWSEGQFTLDSLLSYSAVCGTGIDVVPLPGDVSQEQIQRIISDVASLSFKWHKPLTARLLPISGKKAGDETDFNDSHLVNAKIQPLP